MSTTLVDRHTDATHKLILASAVDLLEKTSLGEVTVRAVARHAGMSERTVFRYFASRDDFLAAVAAEVARVLGALTPPSTIEALAAYPRVLYPRYEEKAALTKAALHTDLFERMREGVGVERWRAVQSLLDAHAPHRTARDRRLAAANIRYYLAATTWHYFRFYFGFSLQETIDAAETAVGLVIEDIARRP